MKKGLLLTLTAAAVSFATAPAVHAMAPTITDPGDVIVGDAEHGGASNEFVFEDAINLGALADDDNVTTPNIQWSYYIAPDPTYGVIYSLNGAAVLGDSQLSTAVAAPAGSQIQDAGNADGDANNVEDADPFTVTFRNVNLSASGAAFNTDPGVSGVVTTQTQAVTLFASDGTTAAQASLVVYTANDTSDSTGVNLELLDDFDFTTDPTLYTNRWLGGVTAGTGTSNSGVPTGLCIGAPLTGNNIINWIYIGGRLGGVDAGSTGGMITLVDGNVWQFRAQMSSTATAVETTPLLDVSFDNTVAEYLNGGPSVSDPFPLVTEGLTYGLEHIILDNTGGANAIDQPQGRNTFQYWISPPGMQLPQWRGVIDGANSAFDPSTDDSNDMNPNFRILDFDSAGLNAQFDTGVICLEHVWIFSAPLTSLRGGQTALLGLPIVNANYAPFNNSQAGHPGTAVIDDTSMVAFYKLINGDNTGGPGQPATPNGTKKTFFPFVASRVIPPGNFGNGDLNPALYIVPWTADTLYLTEVDIRSGVGGTPANPDAGTTEGTAPVDVIQINTIPPTTELVTQYHAVHGSAGTMQNANSPRLAATLVAASLPPNQFYVGMTHGQNGSLADFVTPSVIANGQALQPTLQFLNSNGAILGAGTDEFAVHSIETYSLGQFPNN